MNRKLILLNLTLAVLVAAAGWQLRENWSAARARESAVLAKRIPPAPAPPVAAVPPPAGVQAATYLDVAQKMLFARDRNPNVVIEAVEAPKPKPIPPFPLVYGVMDFGGGATALLSEKAGSPQKSYHAGEKVGQFQIAKLSSAEIVLEWEGQSFPKSIESLKPKADTPPAPNAPSAGSGSQAVVMDNKRVDMTTPEALKDIKEQQVVRGVPGVSIGAAQRACGADDASVPPGAMVGGFRKVVTQTPFGPKCFWEPVGR